MKPEPPPLQIASPCPKKWTDMSGDAKRRFCEHCQLHVHNLSAMSVRERDQFVAESGGHACIAYEVRDDGSMVTPSRWAWLRVPLLRTQQTAAALLAASLPMFFSACATRQQLGKMAQAPEASTKPGKDENRPVMMVGSPQRLPPPKKKR
ncbi:hypothetical protein [Haloferula sp. BvORR071]|uniref:hypothetical protein n=1 Tax=Haloferula sp. BvORR071 TaxID=1396141 RepID=UPI002240F096|nr:hypothetical protein [Haloferula sp. BvORR071]